MTKEILVDKWGPDLFCWHGVIKKLKKLETIFSFCFLAFGRWKIIEESATFFESYEVKL